MRMFINKSDLLFIFNQTKGIGEYTKNTSDFMVNLENFIDGAKNGDMRYKTPEELQNAIANFKRESFLSHGEKEIYDALKDINPNYKWKLYKALHEIIDKFLF